MERVPFGTFVVGPNLLMREGIARILAPDFRILASAASANDLGVASLADEESFLLIMDVRDDFDAAIEEAKCFKRRCPQARIALLGNRGPLSEMVSAFRAGVNAYFCNVPTCEIFVKSLELVMLGVTILPPELLAFLFEDFGHHNRSGNGGQNRDVDTEDGETGSAACAPRQNTQTPLKTNIAERPSPKKKQILRAGLPSPMPSWRTTTNQSLARF